LYRRYGGYDDPEAALWTGEQQSKLLALLYVVFQGSLLTDDKKYIRI